MATRVTEAETQFAHGETGHKKTQGENDNSLFKDPVLPMILSGLTMNFILYEKDLGLAITRLCIVVSTFK